MSWITFIWSMTAGICLTLAAVHFLVWTRQRGQRANLVFSVSAAAAAGYAVLDMVAMRVRTPSEYGDLWRWALLLGMLEGVLIVWFVRLHLRAGRLWLLGLICGLRAVMLFLNFVPGPNFYFREITGLQQVPLLGELISRPQGVLHPWVVLMPLSFVLIILFVIDAARTAAKQNERRRPWVLGGLLAVGFSLALVCYALYAKGILPSTFSSQLFLSLILLMGYELSVDVLQASKLARDLQASEATLRENEQRMSLAVDAANFGIWIRELNRNEIWASDRWRELFGFSPGERLELNMIIQRIHPDDREAVGRAWEKAVAGDGRYEMEYRLDLPDGRERWISSQGRVEFDTAGRPLRVRGASRDCTARKLAEEAAHNLSGRLIHAQEEAQRELARELHDDLNQSLALLSVELEMFGQNPQTEPQKIAARMEEFSARVKGMSSEVHQLSHDLHPAKLDQLGLVAAVRGFCKECAIAHELAIEFTEHDVPRSVPADAALCLYRIAQESLHNMVKHSGGTTAKVELSRTDGHLRLVVSDDGAGFDPQAKANNGSLGLVSMHERARFVGGQLTIESHPGGGTRVDVCVPVAATEEPTSGTSHRPRILLADDHTMLLDAFQRLLEPRCEIVGTAGDGHALLELAASTRPEIIVLDVSMPKLNGIDAGAQLRRSMPEVKLIYLTVNEDPDLAAEAVRLGASGYLLKSSATGELFTAIEHALAGKTYITPLVTHGVPLGVFLSEVAKPGAGKLTIRQREVLQLLAEGRAMKEIADLLQITARTVAFHKYTIMEQLGLKTNTELVQYAVEHGLLRKRG